VEVLTSIDKYPAFFRQWLRRFKCMLHAGQEHPLQPLLKPQRIQAKGLGAVQRTDFRLAGVPQAIAAQGSLYLQQDIGDTVRYIMHGRIIT